MKNVLFVLAACLTLMMGFTGCNVKVETSEATITVVDYDNNPIADRKVYFTTDANFYASIIAPAPDAPLRDYDLEDLDWIETNAQGIARKNDVIVGLTYVFMVEDKGTKNGLVSKKIKLSSKENVEFTLKVNK